MAMTPDEFFFSFVLGNFNDFKDHPDCIRRGFNAVVAASQMADHYFSYYERNDPTRISEFGSWGVHLQHVSEETNGDFRDIRGIAEAYKHLYTWPNVVISSTGAIDLLEIKDENISEVTTDYSKVIYKKRTGEQRDLLPALENVVNFWQKEVHQVDEDITIIPQPKKQQ